ncbi:MAG: hypothetical protein LBG46_05310 [Elusimicrobiota bacterium]|jgi:hypothetical protein|nr:hypothetical protein [Elusimicrobiota bacterium]
MTKILFAAAAFLLVFTACGISARKPYKQYQGIDYGIYERDIQSGGLGRESIDQTNIDAPSFNVDYDDLGNEIIESTGRSEGEAVVIMAAKKIFLSKDASAQDAAAFQKALDIAYRKAAVAYQPSGFTYLMSPAGTLNPLAVMDIQCILGESTANQSGKAVCDLFFHEAAAQYEIIQTESKQNGEV